VFGALRERLMRVKHNISITMDQKLFRELENIRGREKRNTFIEHLIILGLKTYKNKNEGNGTKHRDTPLTVVSSLNYSKAKQQSAI
jgi:metal-responsive CopG/Arc/MetJ family transcriptional regulator